MTYTTAYSGSDFNLHMVSNGGKTASGPGALEDRTPPVLSPVYLIANESFNGFKYPGWRVDRARGLNVSTNFSGTAVVVTANKPGGVRMAYYSSGAHVPANERLAWYEGHLGTAPGSFTLGTGTPSLQEATSMAAGKFYSKVSACRSELKGLVAVGEARESFRLLKSLSEKSVGKMLDYIRKLQKSKRKVKRLQDRRKVLADNWLELQFGLLPFVSDADALYGTLTQEQAIWKVVTGRGKASAPPVVNTVVNSGFGAFRWETTTKSVKSVDVKFLGVVRRRDRTWTGYRPADFGFSLAEFVPSVYNLLPYTFLLDYFTNIGQIVNAWSYSTFESSSATLTVRNCHTWESVAGAARPIVSGVVNLEQEPARFQYEYRTVSRTSGFQVPIPGLSFHLLSSKERRRMIQVGNLGALAATRAFKYWP